MLVMLKLRCIGQLYYYLKHCKLSILICHLQSSTPPTLIYAQQPPASLATCWPLSSLEASRQDFKLSASVAAASFFQNFYPIIPITPGLACFLPTRQPLLCLCPSSQEGSIIAFPCHSHLLNQRFCILSVYGGTCGSTVWFYHKVLASNFNWPLCCTAIWLYSISPWPLLHSGYFLPSSHTLTSSLSFSSSKNGTMSYCSEENKSFWWDHFLRLYCPQLTWAATTSYQACCSGLPVHWSLCFHSLLQQE